MLKKSYMILLATVFFLAGCEKWLDVNLNPNAIVVSPEITENLMLAGVEAEWSSTIHTQGYLDKYFYNLWLSRFDGRRNDFARAAVHGHMATYWNTYVNALKHATELYEKAKSNGNNHYQGIAAVIAAWNWFMLADYHDSAPLSQAMKGNEYPYPEYESFDNLYAHANNLLDEAIGLFAQPAGNLPVRKDDIMGQGDIGRWTRLAWSLKARHAMRLCYAPGKTKTGQADLVLSYLGNGMAGNEDEFAWYHLNDMANRHPIFTKFENDESFSPTTFPGNLQQIDIMNFYNSPLRSIYFEEAEQGGYQGHHDSAPIEEGNAPSYYKTSFLNWTMPFIIMRYHETLFLKAEAYALKGEWANAKLAMDAAIRADMEFEGVPEGEIDTYLAQAILDMPEDEEQAQKLIMEQLYMASVWENMPEVYFNFLRTGYPAFDYSYAWFNPISVSPPRRLPYPDAEHELNPNAPSMPNVFNDGVTWDNKPGRWK